MIYRVEISKEKAQENLERAVSGESDESDYSETQVSQPQVFYVQAQVYGQTGEVDLFSIVDKAGNSVSSEVYDSWLEDEIKSDVFNQHIDSYNK